MDASQIIEEDKMDLCLSDENYYCFKKLDCSTCGISSLHRIKQLVPSERTIGELIAILSQYPPETKVVGVDHENTVSSLMTIQSNCPDDELDTVGLYFYHKYHKD